MKRWNIHFLFFFLGLWCMIAGVAQAGPRILASSFPIYQLVRNVTQGSGATLGLMIPATLGCPHDYALTPQDMHKLAAADVLVINGLGLEEFLGAPLTRANAQLQIVDASADIAAAKAGSALISQMDDAHGHEHAAGAVNPHIFVSPILSGRMAESIAKQLSSIDPAEAARYTANAAQYAAAMQALSVEVTARAARLRNRRIVTQHSVFDYLARDLGLELVAVVQAHPGQEPAASAMLGLIERIKKSGAEALFVEPHTPRRVAETIAREAGIPLAELDPGASSPTDKPDDAPLDSLEQRVRQNLDVLERSLGVY